MNERIYKYIITLVAYKYSVWHLELMRLSVTFVLIIIVQHFSIFFFQLPSFFVWKHRKMSAAFSSKTFVINFSFPCAVFYFVSYYFAPNFLRCFSIVLNGVFEASCFLEILYFIVVVVVVATVIREWLLRCLLL